jgi:hypothetical protein
VASWVLVAVLCAQLICRPYSTARANRLDASTLGVLYVSVPPLLPLRRVPVSPPVRYSPRPSQATQALSWLYFARPATVPAAAAAGTRTDGGGDGVTGAVITLFLLGVNGAMCAALAAQFSVALRGAVCRGRKQLRIAPPTTVAPESIAPVSTGDALPSAIGHEVSLNQTRGVTLCPSQGSDVGQIVPSAPVSRSFFLKLARDVVLTPAMEVSAGLAEENATHVETSLSLTTHRTYNYNPRRYRKTPSKTRHSRR